MFSGKGSGANATVVGGSASASGATFTGVYDKYLAPQVVKPQLRKAPSADSETAGEDPRSEAPITPPKPSMPVEAPCDKLSKERAKKKAKEILAAIELDDHVGNFKPKYANCIAVTVSDDAVTEAELKPADETGDLCRIAAAKIPGLYWKIGSDGFGRAVYRQEPAQPVDDDGDAPTNCDALYLKYKNIAGGGGYVIADTLVDTNAQTVYAFCEDTIGPAFVPYWDSSSFLSGIALCPAHQFFATKFEHVCASLEARACEAAEAMAKKESNAAKSGGGSFNRLVALIHKYDRRDWDAVDEIIAEVKATDLYQKVERAKWVRRKGSGGKGKGGSSQGKGPY